MIRGGSWIISGGGWAFFCLKPIAEASVLNLMPDCLEGEWVLSALNTWDEEGLLWEDNGQNLRGGGS